jgi:uncharacterized membrane protein
MRSDEERDHDIEELLKRVDALETELATIRGRPLLGKSPPVKQDVEKGGAQSAVFSEQKQQSRPRIAADSSLESAIGTRWLGRVGVLAIVFGIAFFLKYSFDNRLIGEVGRIVLGLFSGAVLIAAGEYLQKKKDMGLYGQMLSGGGLAVLYLALYAASALYHLIPVALAAIAMLAVTTTGLTFSIRYSSYPLAGIALLGGFLTPIMLSTGQNQPFTLFGYVLLLDVGTLLLIRFRHWPSLIAASLLGTVVLYAGWHSDFYRDAQRWLAFGIIAVFFVFYNFYAFISRYRSRGDESLSDQIVIFGSAAFFFLSFFSQQHWETTWAVKAFAIVLAGFELGMAELIRRSCRPPVPLTVAAYDAVSAVMTVVATFVALGQHWIMPALAAEMAVFGLIGLRLELPALRRSAYLLGLIVLFRFADESILSPGPFERFIPVFNSRFLVCAAAVAGFYVLLRFLLRYRDKLGVNERYAPTVIFVVTQALSLVLLSVEVRDFFHFRSPRQISDWGSSLYGYQLSLSVLWALYASLLTGVGILKRVRGARVLGILLLGATVLKVFLIDLSSLRTFYRIISFVALGLLLLAVSYSYNRFKHFIFGEDRQ